MSDVTGVGRVKRTQIKVEETGVEITVRDEVHAQVNHYIKQSQPYFANINLYTYIDCPYFLKMARLVFIASLFGALAAVGVTKILPVIFLVASGVFFLVYCQHEWVNQKSLPIVLKQPVFEDQRLNNSFYVVTVRELEGIALQNYQAGIGFVQLTQGKIEFQAFNSRALKRMSNAKCQSRLMFFLFLCAMVYNLYFMVKYTFGVQQPKNN